MLCQVSTIVRVSGRAKQADIISQRVQIPLKRCPACVAHFAFREPGAQPAKFLDRGFVRLKACIAVCYSAPFLSFRQFCAWAKLRPPHGALQSASVYFGPRISISFLFQKSKLLPLLDIPPLSIAKCHPHPDSHDSQRWHQKYNHALTDSFSPVFRGCLG
jgi:hypothetical protein